MKPSESQLERDPLPYQDSKPLGHADFYFAIQATFRFIRERFGHERLVAYWRDLGSSYHRPVSERWRAGGLRAVAEHWRAFFKHEPGAEVEVRESGGEASVEVRVCPAIRHLREHGREILPVFCQHCYFVSEAIAAPAGLTVRVTGGNGSCTQRFFMRDAAPAPQNLEDIATAS